ncbi:MAG: hypothetical protein KF724_06580 [Phycisphaeraceae bacterium]|nr:hypothetical protein [Phycisphaeraceae bacterium]
MSTVVVVLMALALLLVAAAEEKVLPRPIEIRTRTVSGTIVRGMLERWDEQGITGSFGTRRWSELPAAEINRIRRMVMDERSAAEWIALGELLLEAADGEKLSDAAFVRARRLDRDAGPAIDAARERGTERRRVAAEQRLRSILPEGGEFDAKPWPILSASEQSAATEEMKKDAERIMRDAGASMPLVETKYFLLYSELQPRQTAFWASQLDGMYEMCMRLLHVELGINLFWGKAVVFIFPTRERFRVVEASAFGTMVPDGVLGLCHMKGPKVFINSFLGNDELMFASVLLHETTHGIMHRYLTPMRLPTWANEGFADRIAHMAMSRANLRNPMDALRREQGVRYLRQRGDVARIVRMRYDDGSWPGEEAIGYAVGYVMTNFMLDTVPKLAPARGKDRFKDWVVAVKSGKPWEQALREDFGFPIETLADELVKWHRTND